MNGEADVLKHHRLPEAGHRPAAVDSITDNPHDYAAFLGYAQERLPYALRVKSIAIVVTQLVVWRRRNRQVYRTFR